MDSVWSEFFRWDDFNNELLRSLFTDNRYANEYRQKGGYGGGGAYTYLKDEIDDFYRRVNYYVNALESLEGRLPLIQEATRTTQATTVPGKKILKRVFIGHGASPAWRELQAFIRDRLGLDHEEFNRQSPAGLSNKERLLAMLDSAGFAFLVLTAEDEQADGSKRARQNVVHEAGLFQGRYGFERAIIRLEEGCEPFSNIHGLGQIRFPAGNIRAAFEDVRHVLEREKFHK